MAIISNEESPRPDIYIGLVCAAGTDLSEVKHQLQAQLSVVGYSYTEIKVSRLISDLLGLESKSDEFERIKYLMKAGDVVRQSSENGHGVAAAVIADLRLKRDSEDVPSSTAYVIDSLKNPAEIDLFDKVYGRNYYTVSVYLPKEERIENLAHKIAKDRHQPPEDSHRILAEDLVIDDEKGIGKRAQNVRETFPKADYFVNAKEDIPSQVKRFT